MLKIKVFAGTIEVNWIHNNYSKHTTNKMSYRPTGRTTIESSTECIITLYNVNDKVLGEVKGKSVLYYKDNYNKEIGRKVSMAYAIKADKQSDFPMLTDSDIESIQEAYNLRRTKKQLI